ncbi:MAG: hypothetical protein ACI9LE_001383 [Paraglaciecola sp.]|jgi:hypothetical protein
MKGEFEKIIELNIPESYDRVTQLELFLAILKMHKVNW